MPRPWKPISNALIFRSKRFTSTRATALERGGRAPRKWCCTSFLSNDSRTRSARFAASVEGLPLTRVADNLQPHKHEAKTYQVKQVRAAIFSASLEINLKTKSKYRSDQDQDQAYISKVTELPGCGRLKLPGGPPFGPRCQRRGRASSPAKNRLSKRNSR